MRPEAKKEMAAIRHLIDGRLKARLAIESLSREPHLDEDVMCAFVEGRLADAEVSPVMSHLVACATCRHTTAQLIRLGTQFDAESEMAVSPESPGRVRLFLDDLAARLTPAFEEDTVFAYQEPEPGAEVVSDSKPEKPEDGAE